jgi:thymidine kinase
MGHLTLLIGCMFAQKTTELIRRVRCYKSIGYKVLIINFNEDVRYGKDCVATHHRDKEDAVCVATLSAVNDLVRRENYDAIFIDEGQFFPDIVEYVKSWSDELTSKIVICGLDGDSERRPFGRLLELVPYAESVERLTAFCAVCRDGTVATFSQFMNKEKQKDGQIAVGGADMYRPVCRKHFINPDM